jgi:phage gp16-like protein
MGDLGAELWAAVEEPQGSAFVSDGVERLADEEVLRIAAAALVHTNRTARRLRDFLRRHTPTPATQEDR